MNNFKQPLLILMADDDPDDCMLAEEALKESRVDHDLRFVYDGEELMDYLYRRDKYSGQAASPRPDLIVLDLNMPKKDGRKALKEIKNDPDLKDIPIAVLTTSEAKSDMDFCLDLAVNLFITKPFTFSGLVNVMKRLGRELL